MKTAFVSTLLVSALAGTGLAAPLVQRTGSWEDAGPAYDTEKRSPWSSDSLSAVISNPPTRRSIPVFGDSNTWGGSQWNRPPPWGSSNTWGGSQWNSPPSWGSPPPWGSSNTWGSSQWNSPPSWNTRPTWGNAGQWPQAGAPAWGKPADAPAWGQDATKKIWQVEQEGKTGDSSLTNPKEQGAVVDGWKAAWGKQAEQPKPATSPTKAAGDATGDAKDPDDESDDEGDGEMPQGKM